MRRLCHYFLCSIWKFAAFMPFKSLPGTIRLALISAVLLSGFMFPSDGAFGYDGRSAEPIPQDAIRIRVVAHSGAPLDQQVKQDVQSHITAEIMSWGNMPGTHDEARTLIASRLSDVQTVADRALERWDVGYGAEVSLGDAPFPAKTFEGREYAAGDYEALYVQLGGGQGLNWWCVLFPPLCLTAAAAPDEEVSSTQLAGGAADEAGDRAGSAFEETELTKLAKPKPKFFIGELFQKLAAWFRSLLH